MNSGRHILIIGCGPAGTACAITARRHGMRATVVDKAIFPRDKCCGDGLTTLALRLADHLGVTPASIPSWKSVDTASLRSPDGRMIELPLPKGAGEFAAVATRLEFDQSLHDRAIAAGAKVIEGVALTDVSQNADSITATFDDGSEITGDYLIAADGMWSPTRRIVCGESEPRYLGEWHAFRQYLSDVSGPASDRLYVWFEPDLLPGYAWSFPLGDGRVNFGYGILRGGSIAVGEMGNIWEQLFDRAHIKETLGEGFKFIDRRTAWPIPARIDSATLSAGRVLFVGDAACATDPMTGEGIGQAMLTGMLAAEAISKAQGSSLNPAEVYSKAVRRELVADHKMSVFLGRLLSRSRATNLALRIVDTNNWTRRNFARWMFEDEPRAIIATPRRWHRKFFKRTGAYLKR